jgi:hypothetical protein
MREDRSSQEFPRRPAKEVVDKHDWRKGCATGGRGNARRQMAELTRTPPCVTHPPDEKQRLNTCNANLEKQIKKLKAELEAALERKTKATIAAPKEDKVEAQRYVSCHNVRVVAAAAPDGRDRAALRGTQLASD